MAKLWSIMWFVFRILVVRRRAGSHSPTSRLTEVTVPTNKDVSDKDWPHKTASPSPLYRGAVEDSRWFMADSIPSGLLASLARHRRTQVPNEAPMAGTLHLVVITQLHSPGMATDLVSATSI